MVKKQTTKRKDDFWWLRVIGLVTMWFMTWLATQALYMIDVPILSPWLKNADGEQGFINLSIWIMFVVIVATVAWAVVAKGNFSFLKPTKWTIAPYIVTIPLVIACMFAPRSLTFGVTPWLYMTLMVVTNFVQDILTFGFLQTALEKVIKVWPAAILTAVVFYAGHFVNLFDPKQLVFSGVLMLGAVAFVVSRAHYQEYLHCA